MSQNMMCANGKTRHRNQATKNRCRHCRTKAGARGLATNAIGGGVGKPSESEQEMAMQSVSEALSKASAKTTPDPDGYPGETFDLFSYQLKRIKDCDANGPWRREDIEDAERLRLIYDNTFGDGQVRNLEEAEEILFNMDNPYLLFIGGANRHRDSHKERGKRLYDTAKRMIVAAHYQENTSRTTDTKRERNAGLIGADEAMDEYVAGDTYALAGADKDTLDRAINDLIVNGEMEDVNRCEHLDVHPDDYRYHDYTYHFDAYDQCRYKIRDGERYLAVVFPDNELKKAMTRKGVENVRTSSFNNLRENGLVYTVDSPNGDTRSFCAYESRNSDEIIINGITNWDGHKLPYAGETKYDYFSRHSYDDWEGAAEKLASYLSGAQKGTLPSDKELIEGR